MMAKNFKMTLMKYSMEPDYLFGVGFREFGLDFA
jgi:hypothetical protein